MDQGFSRRDFGKTLLVGGMGVSGIRLGIAKDNPIKVGLMLPTSGNYADLGKRVIDGFKLYIDKLGGVVAGRPIVYVELDDESDPAKATEKANRLIKRDQVDVLIGTIHSGVAIAMAKVAERARIPMIIPNAGAGEICGKYIFRSSFTNWQPGYANGIFAAGRHKTAVTVHWKYAGGNESVEGFTEAFRERGGRVIKDLSLPFPDVEFQSILAELSVLKPEACYVFVAGAGQVKFVKDYVAAGLKDKIPLYGAFITEGTLEAQGSSAEGLETVLYYADDLDLEANRSFLSAYKRKFQREPDVFVVQGYDAAQLFAQGVTAVEGRLDNQDRLIEAMSNAHIDSPRGPVKISRAHDPIQNFYSRKVIGGKNQYTGTVIEQLEDKRVGCVL